MDLKVAALGMCLFPITGVSQVPPGHPYDPQIHPNPIVTFVEISDFEASTWELAREAAGFELLGPSGGEGALEDVALAPPTTLEVRVMGYRTEVLTFPVVRQRFGLIDGGTLDLYSFRNPRTDLPAADADAMLDTEAFTPPPREGEGRFGPRPLPETLEVRGRPALLFRSAPGNSVFWQEGRLSHVAVSDIDTATLFRIIDDLL